MCQKKYSHVEIGHTSATDSDSHIRIDNYFSFSITNIGDRSCTVAMKKLEPGDSYSECNVAGLPYMGTLPLNWTEAESTLSAELVINYTAGAECKGNEEVVKKSFLQTGDEAK